MVENLPFPLFWLIQQLVGLLYYRDIVFCCTNDKGDGGENDKDAIIIGLAVGLGVGLVAISVLIVVVVLCRRHRPRRLSLQWRI